nr:MAG TPA: hypothetical protein [Caudoviricetes sp.]
MTNHLLVCSSNGIQTHNLQIRSLLLYSIKLWNCLEITLFSNLYISAQFSTVIEIY